MNGTIKSYAQLLRLPNVFTAFGDILMAAMAVGATADHVPAVVLLTAASGCLYLAGMVWNDLFDRDEDARTRPFRPIPSGRVPVRSAVTLAIALTLLGNVFAGIVSVVTEQVAPTIVAAVLTLAILLYDRWLKRTVLGPLAMGLCRFLNVFLGASLIGWDSFSPWILHLAAVVGLYIVGVTWFARKEEGTSPTAQLKLSTIVIIAALLLAVALPIHRPAGSVTPLSLFGLVAFGVYVVLALVRAIRTQSPQDVQFSVKRSILGLIVLDALLAVIAAGPPGLTLLLLLPPARWLGRTIYST